MSQVIEIFKELSTIQRCSGNYSDFIDYIKIYSSKYNYECSIDSVNNILCKKANSKPKLALQSHYDMVCLVDGKIPQIVEEDGILKAKDSTLGADNGIGCAYMLSLMAEGFDLEYLFTSDEEIGLIGANGLSLPIESEYMLNLDSEDENEICIGCAGGIDIIAHNPNKKIVKNFHEYNMYEIALDNLEGGHSGVDIDKNIPNAIKLVISSIKECDAEILEINGGERINSIPKSCRAIVVSKFEPNASHENMSIKKVEQIADHYLRYSNKVRDFIYSFANGVREYNNSLSVVETSINLAKISSDINGLRVEFSARSMDNQKLSILAKETKTLLEAFNFDEIELKGKYPAWKPDVNEFTKVVENIAKKYNPKIELKAIHAGLECAIFKDKYKNIKVASIGPNIYFPHSNREYTEIESIDNVYNIVKEIAVNYK